MRSGHKRKLWSARKSIAFLILFIGFFVAGVSLLVVGMFGGGGPDTLLGLALTACGVVGAVAAVVELVRRPSSPNV